jgi:hypothetical protein
MDKRQISTIVGVSLLLLLLGYATGRYAQPARVETKIEQVVKEVEVVKKDVVIKERTEKRPDGTIITDRTTEDRSTETTNKDSKTKESIIVSSEKPNWLVSGGMSLNTEAHSIFTAVASRRIAGPIFVSAVINFDQQDIRRNTAGLTIGLEF